MKTGEGWIQVFPDPSRRTGLESPERSMLPSSYELNGKQEMTTSSFIFRRAREKIVTFVDNFRTLLFSQGTFISLVGPKPTSATSDRIVWWTWFQQKLGKDVSVLKWIAVGFLRKPLKNEKWWQWWFEVTQVQAAEKWNLLSQNISLIMYMKYVPNKITFVFLFSLCCLITIVRLVLFILIHPTGLRILHLRLIKSTQEC